MKTATASLHAELDLPAKTHAFLRQSEKYAALCASPKKVEFKLCALLAAWEATALHDSKACYWFDLWQKHCRSHHPGKPRRTLADPLERPPLCARWHISQPEEAKAYATVHNGLQRVFKATLSQYSLPDRVGVYCDEITGVSAVLLEMIRASFKTAKSFACPEGVEVFLLTLIELFEQSLGTDEDTLFSHKAWLSEIRRRRLGGPPETRTLADVVPAEVRLKRQNALPEEERIEIIGSVVSSMRRIMKGVQLYLERQTTRGK